MSVVASVAGVVNVVSVVGVVGVVGVVAVAVAIHVFSLVCTFFVFMFVTKNLLQLTGKTIPMSVIFHASHLSDVMAFTMIG